MKNTIVILLVLVMCLLTTAQSKSPMYVGGFEVSEIRMIYRISATFVIGDDGCRVTHYWYVDEWGRPVKIESYDLKEVMPDDDIVNKYWEFMYPEEKVAENPFESFDEKGM